VIYLGGPALKIKEDIGYGEAKKEITRRLRNLKKRVITRVEKNYFKNFRIQNQSRNYRGANLGIQAKLGENHPVQSSFYNGGFTELLGISVDEIPACCGAALFYNLSPSYYLRINSSDLLKELLDIAEYWAVHDFDRWHLVYYVTSRQPEIEKLLKGNGWNKTDTWTNFNSGNRIYTYTVRYKPRW
jgi:hypothetical protein